MRKWTEHPSSYVVWPRICEGQTLYIPAHMLWLWLEYVKAWHYTPAHMLWPRMCEGVTLYTTSVVSAVELSALCVLYPMFSLHLCCFLCLPHYRPCQDGGGVLTVGPGPIWAAFVPSWLHPSRKVQHLVEKWRQQGAGTLRLAGEGKSVDCGQVGPQCARTRHGSDAGGVLHAQVPSQVQCCLFGWELEAVVTVTGQNVH